MQQAGKYVIIAGLAILVVGIIMFFAGNKLHWIGNLPGDIKIEKENFRFYFPITTMILLSVLVTLIVKLFHMLK